jgi:hypothetical protein
MRASSFASDFRAVPVISQDRDAPAMDAGGWLHATLVDTAAPVRVLEVSFGGFVLETAAPFPVGSRHLFRFETADDSIDLTVAARVVYSRRDSASARHSWYVSGFRFLPPSDGDAAEHFDRLLDLVASALTID